MIKHVFRTLNKSKVLYTGISTVPFRQFSYKPGQQDDLDDEDYDYQLTASDPIKKKVNFLFPLSLNDDESEP